MKKKIVVLMVIIVVSLTIYPESKIDQKVRELEKQLETVSGKERVDILFQLVSITSSSTPEKCIEYCSRIIDISKQLDDPKIRARALERMSYAYRVKGDNENSFKYIKEAKVIYEKEGDSMGMADAMNALGILYINIDYLNTAQDYLLKALKIREEFGDKSKLHYSYLYLGLLYYNLEDLPKAMDHFQKALAIAIELKDSKLQMVCIFYTGACYREMGDYDNALGYLREALALAEKDGENFYIAWSMSHIANIYDNLNQHRQALNYLFTARDIQEKNGYKSALVNTKYFIGNLYLEMKDYPNARSYYDQTIKIAEDIKDKNTLEKVYKKYSDLCADTGECTKALEYYKRYSQTRESIFSEKKMKQITELEMRFEAEKKEKEIEILKKDNKIQKLTRNASIIGLSLVVIILAFVFKKYLYLLAFWKTHRYIWQYRIIEKIGSGGMGTVYLTHAISDKSHHVAVKVLKDELVEDEGCRHRFKQEGIIIDKLDHPHIVKIYERGEHKGKLYIAMEYLRGKTLAQKIKEENKINLQECFQIMKQAALALDFIHSKNVVHRDIKPANIMLIQKDGNSNFVKLLDFGVALMKFQTRLTHSGIMVGTIIYIAPEQIMENRFSPASDIYSLGVVFYEMLTGEHAFQAEALTSVMEKILGSHPREPRQLRPDIPEELNHLIMQMLSKVPTQRPTAGDILKALDYFSPSPV